MAVWKADQVHLGCRDGKVSCAGYLPSNGVVLVGQSPAMRFAFKSLEITPLHSADVGCSATQSRVLNALNASLLPCAQQSAWGRCTALAIGAGPALGLLTGTSPLPFPTSYPPAANPTLTAPFPDRTQRAKELGRGQLKRQDTLWPLSRRPCFLSLGP